MVPQMLQVLAPAPQAGAAVQEVPMELELTAPRAPLGKETGKRKRAPSAAAPPIVSEPQPGARIERGEGKRPVKRARMYTAAGQQQSF